MNKVPINRFIVSFPNYHLMISFSTLTIIAAMTMTSPVVAQTPPTPVDSELPAWTTSAGTVDKPQITDDGELFVVQTSDFSIHRDATKALYPAARKAIKTWALNHFGSDELGLELTDDTIEEEFVFQKRKRVHTFQEVHNEDDAKRLGQKYELYYRGYIHICVSPELHDRLFGILEQDRIKSRLVTAMTTGIAVLGLLSVAWCYLRGMQLTRGLYRGRLRWIAAALLVLLATFCYLVHRTL